MKKNRKFACVLCVLTIVLTGFGVAVPARAEVYSGYWSDEGCYSAPELDGSTYIITGPEELGWVAAQTDNNFDGYTIALESNINLCGHYWKPIGYFKGTFEGNNHTISNLKMGTADVPYSGEYGGLFREIIRAVIQNVGIDAEIDVDYAAEFDGQWRYKTAYIGGVAARASYSAITNCTVSGNLNTEHTAFIGGIAGYGDSLTITDCTAGGSVTGGLTLADITDTEIPYAGLIIGYLQGDSGISGCNASGSVTCGDNAYAGGIAGTCTGISDCSFTGSVTCGGGAYAGGLVGWSYGNVEGCHASGDIESTGTQSRLGGLFGYAEEGTIKNCYSTGSVEDGSNSTSAGFIAHAEYCSIENCFSSSDVRSGDSSTAGGFIAYGANSSVENCYVTGSVTGGKNGSVDGFSPSSFLSDFTYCYAAGDVTGGIGAIASVFKKNSTIALSGCYWNTDAALTANGVAQSNSTSAAGLAAVQMTGENAAANMTGLDFSGTDSIWVTASGSGSAIYFPQLRVFAESGDADVAAASLESAETGAYYKVTFDIGAGTQTDSTPLEQWVQYGDAAAPPALAPREGYSSYCWDGSYTDITADITIAVRWLADWDGTAADRFESGSGTEADPYIIIDGPQLARLAALVNAGAADAGSGRPYTELCYQLARDINLSGNTWTPIGIDRTACFGGIFDGGGHTISYLSIGSETEPDTTYPYAGLFGCVDGAAAEDLKIADSAVYTADEDTYAGMIAGFAAGSEISGCSAEGEISGAYAYALGGIVGEAYDTATENSSADVDILGGGRIGGLLGYVSGGSVSGCSAWGTIGGNAGVYAGGLVGYADRECRFSQCYAAGGVSGGASSGVGGLVGYLAAGEVTDCYATGNAACGDGGMSGGLAGFAGADCATENCYGTGSVTGGSGASVGGFLGQMDASNIASCYWNTSAAQTVGGMTRASSEKIGAGNNGSAAGITSLATVQMTRENALANMTGFGFSGTAPVWVTADNAGAAGYFPQLRVFAESADAGVAAASLRSAETDAYYKVTFTVGAGTHKDTTPLEQWVIYTGPAAVPALEMTGYLLSGWNSLSQGWYSFDAETDDIKGDTTFYPIWKLDAGYRLNGITLYDSGGEETDAIPASAFTARVSADLPGAPGVRFYVILAAYDASGRLVDIRCESAAVDYGQVLRFSFELDGGTKSISSVKAMLLDAQGGPIAEAAVI